MRNAGVKAELASFFNDLPARMAKAHLVIGRSGAGTVAELMVIGRPAILVPLPHALDDNQTPNADVLVPMPAPAGASPQSDLTPAKARRDADRARSPIAGRSGAARCGGPCARQTRRRATSRRSRRTHRGRHDGAASVSTRVPFDIGTIHFIGIGGIGMSGIAEIMHNLGYKVQGSDAADSANVKRLRAHGHSRRRRPRRRQSQGRACRRLFLGGEARQCRIRCGARCASLPLVRRAEMLAEIMRLKNCVAIAGTNGKTTTTTLVAALLDAGGLDPTVVNGGIINAYGTNARLGAGEWVVVEADESDGTFLRLPATVAVVTNVDPDHLDYYGTFERMRDAFQRFVENVPFYGFAVLCLDHPEVQAMVGRIDRPPHHHLWLQPAGRCARRQCEFLGRRVAFRRASSPTAARARETRLDGMRLPMPGEHNVQNALAAIVVARELGVDTTT